MTEYIIKIEEFGSELKNMEMMVLDPSNLTDDELETGTKPKSNQVDVLGNKVWRKTHPSGWTIEGIIEEDYYLYVDEFTAIHPIYGTIIAYLDDEIIASSKEAYDHFIENHPLEIFDLGDI